VSIDANPIAEFSANPNVFTKDSETIQFVNNSKGAVTYKWDF
jgi:PKD repeat protein